MVPDETLIADATGVNFATRSYIQILIEARAVALRNAFGVNFVREAVLLTECLTLRRVEQKRKSQKYEQQCHGKVCK